MVSPHAPEPRPTNYRLAWIAWPAATVGLAALYMTVFALTEVLTAPLDIVLWAFCNAAPHVLLAIPLVDRIGPMATHLSWRKAAAISLAAGVAYVATAYGATIFLLALTARVETEGLWVRFFTGPALSWQTFQGLTYAALAVMTGLWLETRRQLEQLRSDPPAPVAAPQRWLVRTVDGIVPVDPLELIRIEAEGEYSRLVLPGRAILSRIGLGDCAERVRGLPFLRVHRSHLVNGDTIQRAEPAGNGRLQLTLRNGDQVVTSREGARLVRATAI